MKSKVLSIIIAISLCFGLTTYNSSVAFASPLNVNHVDDIYNKIDNIESVIQKYDNSIEQVLLKIRENDKHINEVQAKIKNKQNEINQIQKSIDEKQNILNERIKVMYMNGSFGNQYLSFILSSDSLSELMSRVHISKFLVDFDKKIIKDMNSSKEKINNTKKELEKEKENVFKIKKNNEEKMKVIEKEKDKQQKLLAQLEETQFNSKSNFAPKSVLQDINSRIRNTRVSRGDNNKANLLVSYSTRFLGVPYLWGGTTPNGFDCSGFVQYVYAHNGIQISRVARDQQHDGYPIASNLQPGDLLFYGNPAHHVTMYVGNGYMIEAPHTGSFVKIGPVRSYTNARRIIR